MDAQENISFVRPLIDISKRRKAALLPGSPDMWDIDGPTHTPGLGLSYEYSFENLLPEGVTTFEQLLQKRKEQHLPAHALDLFGGGYFIKNLSSVDSITAMRLRNVDEDFEKELKMKMAATKEQQVKNFYQQRIIYLENLKKSGKRHTIEGNLYTTAPWRKMKETMPPEGYDLIVCRPFGAFHEEYIGKAPWYKSTPLNTESLLYTYFIMLSRAYEVCSQHNGMIFSEIPDISEDNTFFEELKQTCKEAHIELEITLAPEPRYPIHRKILRLIKTDQSPSTLSFLRTNHPTISPDEA